MKLVVSDRTYLAVSPGYLGRLVLSAPNTCETVRSRKVYLDFKVPNEGTPGLCFAQLHNSEVDIFGKEKVFASYIIYIYIYMSICFNKDFL